MYIERWQCSGHNGEIEELWHTRPVVSEHQELLWRDAALEAASRFAELRGRAGRGGGYGQRRPCPPKPRWHGGVNMVRQF